jgi:alpha-D-ribose 1-methylphosphonate 5-triphosphate synthase subunit PhnH
MMAAAPLLPGFGDVVHDSHRVFRATMNALARPGTIHPLGALPPSPAPLNSGAAALILALADHETPIWLDETLAGSVDVAAYFRFHTGAPLTKSPEYATFAVVSDGLRLPPLETFSGGTLEYPDRSTTVVVQVSHLASAGGWQLTGPGIDGSASLDAGPLPTCFPAMMTINRSRFPRGVDLLLATQSHMAGLPRTTAIET